MKNDHPDIRGIEKPRHKTGFAVGFGKQVLFEPVACQNNGFTVVQILRK